MRGRGGVGDTNTFSSNMQSEQTKSEKILRLLVKRDFKVRVMLSFPHADPDLDILSEKLTAQIGG